MRTIIGYCFILLSTCLLISCGDSKEKESEIARIEDSIKNAKLNVTGTVHVEMNRDAKNLSIARVKGYRVQIFTGKDREEAMKAKTLFIRNFPDVDNYLEYEEPNYKVRVGDFLSRFSASDLLTKVNKTKGIEGSFIVKCMVNAELPKPEQDTIPDSELIYYTLIDSAGQEIKIPVLKSSLSPLEQDSIKKVEAKPEVHPAAPVNETPKEGEAAKPKALEFTKPKTEEVKK